MPQIHFHQQRSKPHTHQIADECEVYYFNWPEGWTTDQVIEDFVSGGDYDDGGVRGDIRDHSGDTIHTFLF